MGDLRAVEPADSGIWARYEHNKLEKGSDTSLKYNYFQLGYDKDFKGATGTFYRGAAFSYGKGTGEYEVGTGDLKEGALSLYQTWIGKSGNYYDIIAKVGKLSNSYDVTNTANPYTSDCNTWSYSIGGEVGRRIKRANGFFVEPQVEFTLSRINSTDYNTSTDMPEYQQITLTKVAALAGSAQYNALAKAYGLQLGGSNPCTIDGLTAKVQALGTASDYTHDHIVELKEGQAFFSFQTLSEAFGSHHSVNGEMHTNRTEHIYIVKR